MSFLVIMLRVRAADVAQYEGQQVTLRGWVARLRTHGGITFFDLRDAGSGTIQCVVSEKTHLKANPKAKGLAKLAMDVESTDISYLNVESSVIVTGIISAYKRGYEVHADQVEIVSSALGCVDQVVNYESSEELKADQRHLMLRMDGPTQLMKIRAQVLEALRAHYKDYVEVTPPTLVQTACEGGSDLFGFDFFGEKAYLTQSSQLYLETAIAALGDVFCIMPSYRAEKSRTRRHLAEYTHVEAEMPWITFDELLERMEHLIVDVSMRVGKKKLDRPFYRMDYKDAVAFCHAHNITKLDETGQPTDEHYQLGDDLPESAERAILEIIDAPLFLCRFPASLKAFYMARDPQDPTLTLSADLLLPGVGEVIGGSIRIDDYQELMDAFAREGIDPAPYYWYTDQRKFGSVPHGGYGLGFERLLMFLTGQPHIRNVCMYPRYRNRCTP